MQRNYLFPAIHGYDSEDSYFQVRYKVFMYSMGASFFLFMRVWNLIELLKDDDTISIEHTYLIYAELYAIFKLKDYYFNDFEAVDGEYLLRDAQRRDVGQRQFYLFSSRQAVHDSFYATAINASLLLFSASAVMSQIVPPMLGSTDPTDLFVLGGGAALMMYILIKHSVEAWNDYGARCETIRPN